MTAAHDDYFTAPTTPTPGDLSARHMATLEEWRRGDQASTEAFNAAIDYAIAALSALPAAGGEESSCTLFGCAYQLAGYHDAPEVWLDRLSDAMQGRPLPDSDTLIAQLLPYAPTTTPQPSAAEPKCAKCGDSREEYNYNGEGPYPCRYCTPDAAVGAQGDGVDRWSDEDREKLLNLRHWLNRSKKAAALWGAFVDDLIARTAHPAPGQFSTGLAAPAAGKGVDALEQALTDPENQPSQWGTIPLSMLPARKENPYSEPMQGPSDHDEWTEYGEIIGWNSCLDALTRQPVAGDGWLPIESAPRDGRRVLIDGGVWWHSDCDTKHAVSQAEFAYWKGENWRLPRSSEREYFAAPVRWMPLYAPAATPTDGGEGKS